MVDIQAGQNSPISTGRIVLGIAGEPKESFARKVQAGAFLLGSGVHAESHADFITESNVRSRDSAVVFDAGKGQFQIDLPAVEARIEKIAIVLAIRSRIGRGTTFGTFAAIRTFVADITGTPQLVFSLPMASRGETALILGEIYRYKQQWKFRAIGQGFLLGLPALAAHFGLEIRESPEDRELSPAPRPVPGAEFSGTGFCINPEGYFMTNHHVIENAVHIQARSPRNRYSLQPVFSDPLNDLALLKGPEATPAIAVFRDGPQACLGESIIAIGYPLGGLLGSSPQVTTGNVSSLIGPRDDTRALQFTAPIQAGNSGGPLLDADGRVVGVVSSKLDAVKIHELTGDVPQNVNFAIKTALVRSFLEAVGVDYTSRPAGTVARLSTEVVTEAQKFVVRIECRG